MMSYVHVVLVSSLYSRNVGSVSRAMANIGAGHLILINSKCEYDLDARQGAAGAQTRLVEARRYKNWSDFFENEKDGIRVAFSSRLKNETDAMNYADRMQEYQHEISAARPLYIIFGPEDHGLTNEDCNLAHHIHELPIYGDFKSLNLSHAVLLALFITQQNMSKVVSPPTNTLNSEPGAHPYFPELPIINWLETLGLTVGDRRTDAYKVLKRFFLKQRPTEKEMRILEVVVQQTIRKLKAGQKQPLN